MPWYIELLQYKHCYGSKEHQTDPVKQNFEYYLQSQAFSLCSLASTGRPIFLSGFAIACDAPYATQHVPLLFVQLRSRDWSSTLVSVLRPKMAIFIYNIRGKLPNAHWLRQRANDRSDYEVKISIA